MSEATPAAQGPLIWVTGARGMLGQAVTQALVARRIAHVGSGSEVSVTEPATLAAFAAEHRPTHIINCAAFTQVDACETQEKLAYAVNAEGPKHLAQLAKAHGAFLAHVSTDYVFDGEGSAPLKEQTACAPKSVYGQSKWQGEQHLWAESADAASKVFVVRTSWLFGPGGGNFVATMMRLMREKPAMDVVDDQVGRPTVTWDLADALIDILGLGSTPVAAGGIYHFANAGAVSWHGLAQATFEMLVAQGATLACRQVRKTDSSQFVRPAPRPSYSVFDTAKIAQALGREPRSFRVPLAAFIAQSLAQTESSS